MWILHWFYRCFSTPDGVAEASSCAMSGPSWGYLRRTWELFGSTLGHIVPCWGNLERTWRLFVLIFCHIAHAKWQCWIYTGFSVVFDIVLMAESSSCEMSGLSWGYLGRTLGLLGSILGASCAMVGQSWEKLEATWFNLGWHRVCEMKNVHFALVLFMFFDILLVNTSDMWVELFWKWPYFLGFSYVFETVHANHEFLASDLGVSFGFYPKSRQGARTKRDFWTH